MGLQQCVWEAGTYMSFSLSLPASPHTLLALAPSLSRVPPASLMLLIAAGPPLHLSPTPPTRAKICWSLSFNKHIQELQTTELRHLCSSEDEFFYILEKHTCWGEKINTTLISVCLVLARSEQPVSLAQSQEPGGNWVHHFLQSDSPCKPTGCSFS